MRRPSRQGPIPVCKPGSNIITAEINSLGRSISGTIPVTLIYCFSILPVARPHAQNIREEVHQYLHQVRTDHDAVHRPAFLSALPENGVIMLLESFLNDSSAVAREKAYELMYTVSSRSSDSSVRKKGVLILAKGTGDHDSGIRTSVLDLLKEFDPIDFNRAARDTLSKIIRMKVTPLDRLVKLVGFLNLLELVPDIRLMSQAGNPPHLRWAALQSLARMGQATAVENMLQRVKRLPVNDDLVYDVFPDLIFTRRREAIAFVVEALMNDEKACLSADIEREVAIPCGYRIMEQLAPVIEGFPLELDAIGDVRTDDYRAALDNVRRWFSIHKNYTINNSRY